MKKRQVQKVTSDDVAQGQKDGSTQSSGTGRLEFDSVEKATEALEKIRAMVHPEDGYPLLEVNYYRTGKPK